MSEDLTNFYSIEPRGEPQADLAPHWWKQYRHAYRCPECGKEQKERSHLPINVLLIDEPTPGALVMGLSPLKACIARRDFIDLFADAAKDYLLFGNVQDMAGNEYPEYITYTARRILPFRGKAESILGYCNTCGRIRYYPMPYEYEYICTKDIVPGRLLYTNNLVPLIVSEPLLDRLDLKTRKKLKIKKILVKHEAEDGLDRFPDPFF